MFLGSDSLATAVESAKEQALKPLGGGVRRGPRARQPPDGEQIESYLHDAWFFGIRTGHAVMVETKMGQTDPTPVILGMQDEFQELMERLRRGARTRPSARRSRPGTTSVAPGSPAPGSGKSRSPRASSKPTREASTRRCDGSMTSWASRDAAQVPQLFALRSSATSVTFSKVAKPRPASGSASTFSAAPSRSCTSSSAFFSPSSGRSMSAISSVVP